MINRLIFVFAALLALTLMMEASGAKAEEGHHTIGIQGGEVLTSQDINNRYGNGLGIGAFFDYAASDFLEFELNYLNTKESSNGPNYTQNAVGAALQYNVDTFDIFTPYIKGGAEFVGATEDLPLNGGAGPGTASTSTSGFGLDVGLGAKIDLGSHLMAGLDLMYHSIFNVTATPPGYVASVNTIQSYTTFMLRFGFVFGGK